MNEPFRRYVTITWNEAIEILTDFEECRRYHRLTLKERVAIRLAIDTFKDKQKAIDEAKSRENLQQPEEKKPELKNEQKGEKKVSKLLEKVRALVQEHASEIKEEWAPYGSNHEAQNVLREELEEVRVEFNKAVQEVERLWERTKEGKSVTDGDLVPDATPFERLAYEAIQCAAVCTKWAEQAESGYNPFLGYVKECSRNDHGFITRITLKNGAVIEFKASEEKDPYQSRTA